MPVRKLQSGHIHTRIVQRAQTKLGSVGAALIYRRGPLQCGEQGFGAVWDSNSFLEDDRLCAHFLAVEVFVSAVVGAKSGTFQGRTSER